MMISKELLLDKEKIDSRNFYYFSKRFFDIIAATIGLILLTPIMLIIAVLIKREDNGPIFYKQIRVGKNEKEFEMYKFRSMRVGADKMINQLKDKNDVQGPMFKMKEDPRITKIGHFIRKHSLDELPQFFNVIKGDMSLVGPRPPLPAEVKKYTDYDKQRLYVIPGCTGLWQATERNNVGFDQMIELDLKYIKNASLIYDLWLIFKTIGIILKPNGSY